MKPPFGPPPRLVELSAAEDPTGAAECILAAAETPFDISGTARRQIRARLRQTMTAGSRSPAARTRFALAAAVLLLLCGGVVGAAVGPIVSTWIFRRQPAALDEAARTTTGRHRRSAAAARPALPPSTALPARTEPVQAPAATAVEPPVAPRAAPSRSLALRASPAPRTRPPGGSEAPAAEPESELIANAIRQLRVEGDASAALQSLEQQSTRYPRGAFALEGAALRIEALLKVGRRDEALRDLDRLPVDSLPRGDQWRTVRGELRAESARWRDAEADFDAVLGERSLQASASLTARALWGRAVSRARAGNEAGARADYAEYVRRFPNGRFARQAARATIGRP
jgi:hypothetical protein